MPQRVQPLPQAGRQPARPSEGPGLVLTAVSMLCTVLGTVLLCLGVFVMKDPVPQAAPVAEQTETQPQEAEGNAPRGVRGNTSRVKSPVYQYYTYYSILGKETQQISV